MSQRSMCLVALATLAVALSSTATRAQDPDSLFRQFNQAYDADKFTEAEALARKLLSASTTSSWKAAAGNCLGRSLKALGRKDEAERAFQTAIGIKLGSANSNNGWIPLNLGMLYLDQDKLDQAEPLLRRALEYFQRVGPRSSETSNALQCLGDLEHDRKNYAKSGEYHAQALAIRESLFGKEHELVGFSVFKLADIARHQEQFERSDELYRRALAMQTKLQGPDHQDLADTLTAQAILFRDRKDFAAAEAADRRALEIRRQRLPAGDPKIEKSLANLALDLEPQGRAAELETLRKEVVATPRQRVEVSSKTAPVSAGTSTIATLRQGQQFDVIATKPSWYGVEVEIGGEKKTGWLSEKDIKLLTGPPPAARRWRSFTPPGEKFSLEFPGEPKRSAATGGGVQAVVYTASVDGRVYKFGYFDVPVGMAIDPAVGVRAYAAARKAKVLGQKNIELQKYPGHQFDFQLPDGSVGRVQSAVIQRRQFELEVLTPPGKLDEPDTQRYFQSFKLE